MCANAWQKVQSLVNGVALKSFTKALSFSAAQSYDGLKNPKKLSYLSKESVGASSFCSLLLGPGFTNALNCHRFPLLCGCILRIDLEGLVVALEGLGVAV
jgi:hypothetical protein